MNNKVVEVLTLEHGQKVKKYFQSQGIDTGNYNFTCTKDSQDPCRYYGVVSGAFNSYLLEEVVGSHCELIELPEEKTFPRMMLVSNDNEHFRKEIVLGYFEGYERPYLIGGYSLIEKKQLYAYEFAKELPEAKKMTIKEIEEELGYKIKIVK